MTLSGRLMQDVLPAAEPIVEAALNAQCVVLHITHHWGGGTEQHVQELVHHLADAATHFVLHGRSDGFVVLSAPGQDDRLYHPRDDFSDLIEDLRRSGVTRVHVHQLFTVPVDVRRLIEELDVSFDFTVHDYHTFCPRVHLKTRNNAYCGEPGEVACASCLEDWRIPDERDIVQYRARYAWVYALARTVICPSRDVAARVERYSPQARVAVAPHLRRVAAHPPVSIAPLSASEPLRIAVLGWITAFKGAARVLDAARIIAEQKLPLRIQVIGSIDGETPPGMQVTGRYETNDLQRLLAEARPHLLWYAAQVPETYSYVLSEGLEAGLPVLAPRLGAFPERVHGRPWSWIVDWSLSAEQAVATLMTVRQHFLSGVAPATPDHEVETRASIHCSDFYRTVYLDGAT
jgi:glycosyltransferase involved in cell wall biosynthesis